MRGVGSNHLQPRGINLRHACRKRLIAALGITGPESQADELPGQTVGKPTRLGRIMFWNCPPPLKKDNRRVTDDKISEFGEGHESPPGGQFTVFSFQFSAKRALCVIKRPKGAVKGGKV